MLDKMTKQILITDYVHPALPAGLAEMGLTMTYAPEMTRAEMAAHLDGYTGVVINTRCAIDRATLEGAPSLRWIARLGSGLDIIDLDAAAEKGVQVFSAPEGNARAVAEHALGMLLALNNKLLPADRSVRAGQWLREEHRGVEIDGKTLGIIGHGNNGSAFGRLFRGWNVRVIAYDKYLRDYGTETVTETDLDTVLAQSDILSLHIPLTAETRDMVDAAFLARCKPGQVLINTSRGKVADLGAIADALDNGRLRGACLDVFPHEPPLKGPDDIRAAFDRLIQMDNVVLTPHVAGWSVESKQKIAETLVRKIRAAIA
jgi:D-3-phosphoglycerate dehydrogenase